MLWHNRLKPISGIKAILSEFSSHFTNDRQFELLVLPPLQTVPLSIEVLQNNSNDVKLLLVSYYYHLQNLVGVKNK